VVITWVDITERKTSCSNKAMAEKETRSGRADDLHPRARQRAEEALRESEERLRRLSEAAFEGIVIHDEGVLLSANDQFCEMFGYQPDELLGKQMIPLTLAPESRDIVRQQIATGSLGPYEVVGLKKDGSRFPIEVRARKTAHEGHRIGVAVVRDITERKQAEEALHRSQTELKTVYDNAPAMMCVLDSSRQVLYANRAFAEFVGRPAEELRLERACGVIGCLRALDDPRGCGHGPRCETCAMRLAMVDALATGRSHRAIEYRTTALCHGQPRDSVFLASVAPIQLTGQSNLLLCLEDITKRQRAMENLCRSEERYRLLFATSLDAVLLTAPDGRILAANDAACQMFGCSEEELARAGRSGVVDGSDPRLRAALDERERTGRFHGELTLLRRDGSKFLAELSSAVFRDQEGEVRTSMVIRDITERKRAEEALRQLSGRFLQMQDEERRRLARDLHDTVAQGLAALSLNLGLLQSSATALNPRSNQLLADSQALADQCANEVRTSSYLLHPPILDELGLVGAVRDHADGFAHRTGLRVDLELPPDLVRLPRETELALFRVLQEALANIQRHSGSKTASIRVAQTADDIRLEVRDKGRGMAPERGLPARFGRPMFTDARERLSDIQSGLEARAPGAVSGSAPLGMGIFGMRERMQQLGGRLEIQSDGHGTLVIATVPRNQETCRA